MRRGARKGLQPRKERPPRDRPPRERQPRRRRERPAREPQAERSDKPGREAPRRSEPAAPEPAPAAEQPAASGAEPAAASANEPARPRRRRRRRRFGRKGKGLRVHDLLTPPPGRQALVYGESRAACTALLREVAGELASASDRAPTRSPCWSIPRPRSSPTGSARRRRPRSSPPARRRHASDALAQAVRRAEGGEDVILLVDSLSRFAETFDDARRSEGASSTPARQADQRAAKRLADRGRGGERLSSRRDLDGYRVVGR